MYTICFFPKNLPEEIQEFRKKYDFKWELIPPHITLVFPFEFADESVLIEHIKEKTKNTRPFEIIINGYKESHDDYLYLTFKRGDLELMNLHDSLYTGILQKNLRTDIEYEPHLTVGYFQNEKGEVQKELHVQALKELKYAPIYWEGQVDSVTLIEIKDQLDPRRLISTIRFK